MPIAVFSDAEQGNIVFVRRPHADVRNRSVVQTQFVCSFSFGNIVHNFRTPVRQQLASGNVPVVQI